MKRGPTFRDKTWTTNDGRTMKIRNMDDKHILNTIKHFKSKFNRYIKTANPELYNSPEFELIVNSYKVFKEYMPSTLPVYQEAVYRGLIKDTACAISAFYCNPKYNKDEIDELLEDALQSGYGDK